MDGRRFDAASRLLGMAGSRRQAMAAVIGALFGASAFGAAAGERDSGRHDPRHRDDPWKRDRRTNRHGGRPGAEGPCGDGSGKANSCTRNRHCCTRICDRSLDTKDGRGRCRCLHKGAACKADRNCCRDLPCVDGVCGTRRPGPEPACSSISCADGCCSGDACEPSGDATCGTGGGACVDCAATGQVCRNGACEPFVPVATGEACNPSVDTCADSNATCTEYRIWSGGPAGTYCLLDVEAACAAATDCTVNSCYRGACVACSCEACATGEVDCANPTVSSGESIQAAIDAADEGDVITIAPGTYSETLAWAGKSLALVGCPDGTNEVVISNADQNRVITATTWGGTLEIVDIVVLGNNDVSSSFYGGGIYSERNTSLCGRTRVEKSVVGDYGGGIQVYGDRPERLLVRVLDHTIIQDNETSIGGGGLSVDRGVDGEIGGMAQILNNRSDSYGGGVYTYTPGTLTVSGDVRIAGNVCDWAGGGIVGYPDGNLTAPTDVLKISGNVQIDGNSTKYYVGGGIALVNNNTTPTGFDRITIEDNVQITNNTATLGGGGGIHAYSAHVVIRDSVKITGNSAVYPPSGSLSNQMPGGGIMAIGRGELLVLDISGDVEISGNTADSYGGGIGVAGTMNLSGNVKITGNRANDRTSFGGYTGSGGGIGISSVTTTTVTISENVTITGNIAEALGGGIWSNGGINVVTIAGSVQIADNTAGGVPNNCDGEANGGALTC